MTTTTDPAAPITTAEEWQRAADSIRRVSDWIRVTVEPILEVVGAIADTWRMDLLTPTPHDYKAARVQLRREGWADPLPIATIDHRARALAAGAWRRTLKGVRP